MVCVSCKLIAVFDIIKMATLHIRVHKIKTSKLYERIVQNFVDYEEYYFLGFDPVYFGR
jgi:hypothetical protein